MPPDRAARVRMMTLSGPAKLTYRICGSASEGFLALHDPSKPKGSPFNQAPSLDMPRSEWSGGSDSQHRFAAGVPVEIRFNGQTPATVHASRRWYGHYECNVAASLVPQAGVDYEVRFRFVEFDQVCRITINRLHSAQEEGRVVSRPLLPVDVPARCDRQ